MDEVSVTVEAPRWRVIEPGRRYKLRLIGTPHDVTVYVEGVWGGQAGWPDAIDAIDEAFPDRPAVTVLWHAIAYYEPLP